MRIAPTEADKERLRAEWRGDQRLQALYPGDRHARGEDVYCAAILNADRAGICGGSEQANEAQAEERARLERLRTGDHDHREQRAPRPRAVTPGGILSDELAQRLDVAPIALARFRGRQALERAGIAPVGGIQWGHGPEFAGADVAALFADEPRLRRLRAELAAT